MAAPGVAGKGGKGGKAGKAAAPVVGNNPWDSDWGRLENHPTVNINSLQTSGYSTVFGEGGWGLWTCGRDLVKDHMTHVLYRPFCDTIILYNLNHKNLSPKAGEKANELAFLAYVLSFVAFVVLHNDEAAWIIRFMQRAGDGTGWQQQYRHMSSADPIFQWVKDNIWSKLPQNYRRNIASESEHLWRCLWAHNSHGYSTAGAMPGAAILQRGLTLCDRDWLECWMQGREEHRNADDYNQREVFGLRWACACIAACGPDGTYESVPTNDSSTGWKNPRQKLLSQELSDLSTVVQKTVVRESNATVSTHDVAWCGSKASLNVAIQAVMLFNVLRASFATVGSMVSEFNDREIKQTKEFVRLITENCATRVDSVLCGWIVGHFVKSKSGPLPWTLLLLGAQCTNTSRISTRRPTVRLSPGCSLRCGTS